MKKRRKPLILLTFPAEFLERYDEKDAADLIIEQKLFYKS